MLPSLACLSALYTHVVLQEHVKEKLQRGLLQSAQKLRKHLLRKLMAYLRTHWAVMMKMTSLSSAAKVRLKRRRYASLKLTYLCREVDENTSWQGKQCEQTCFACFARQSIKQTLVCGGQVCVSA